MIVHYTVALTLVIGEVALIDIWVWDDLYPKSLFFTLSSEVDIPASVVELGIKVPDNILLLIESKKNTILIFSNLILSLFFPYLVFYIYIKERE